MDEQQFPLFVLPMVLFPGEQQELRIFEPRYKQMLDTCILDERNFGLVMSDPFRPINFWDGPRMVGCEAEILEHETRGSNHFLTIRGGRRFKINNMYAPALPPLTHPSLAEKLDEDMFPDLETLYELIPEDVEHHRLYIAADVTYDDIEGSLDDSQQAALTLFAQSMLKRFGSRMDFDDDLMDEWIEKYITSTISKELSTLYLMASLFLPELEMKQQLLACDSVDEAYQEFMIHTEIFEEGESFQ
ncbi:MAG: LON peptidase substrate-binding domain-containing protein [archaeon]|nr:LON peptidase substrate-binding domain-containing protein [archaeon]